MDLNNDGYYDIVAGSYKGKITYYAGSKDGFEVPKELRQTTDINKGSKVDFREYLFTSSTLGDFNNDGNLDMFVGGSYGARVMINEGTNMNPLFGKRTNMHREDGSIVTSVDFTAEDRAKVQNDVTKLKSTDFKSYVYLIDWDNDGVKDLIISSCYFSPEWDLLLFYKGIETNKGLIFKQPISLVQTIDGSKEYKSIPCGDPVPCFCDINNDGKLDILLGVTMSYDVANHCFNSDVLYNTPAYMSYQEKMYQEMKELFKRADISDEEKLELRKKLYNKTFSSPMQVKKPLYKNCGFVLLFLGK